jgi:mannosyl-oligosaccharide alpha-1,2-mannosidase
MSCIDKPLPGPNLTTLSPERLSRYQQVQSAIRHAWNAYHHTCLQNYPFTLSHWLGALPPDDVAPLTPSGITWLHSAATLYDSLDTLYLVGLEKEYNQAATLAKSLPLPLHPTKTFEYSIRVLGGLLGGHTVTGDEELLAAAVRVADSMLEGAFASSPTALPRMYDMVAPASTSSSSFLGWGGNALHRVYASVYRRIRDWMGEHEVNSLAGVGSFSLEFTYLSSLTGDVKYKNAAHDILHHVMQTTPKAGSHMVPFMWNVMTGQSHINMTSLGSGSDSFYEYLIKGAILEQPLADERDVTALGLYESVVQEALLQQDARHVKKTRNKNVSFPVDRKKYNHLLCFIPGMLALGETYYLDGLNSVHGEKNAMSLAKQLADGCLDSYKTTMTGLGPEEILFSTNKPMISDGGFYLRPEFVESLFILYRTTGDKRYQDFAWDIFQSIEKYCKVEKGYVGLKHINKNGDANRNKVNEMPSFFLAETLKYLALIFAPDDYVNLDSYVFTTEAHPLLQVRHHSDNDCAEIDSMNLRQPSSPILSFLVNTMFCLLIMIKIVPRISRRQKSKLNIKKKI